MSAVDPQDLAEGAVIVSGTLPARVESWRWHRDRGEIVVCARYTDDAPEYYRGDRTELVFKAGEQAQMWQG